MARIEIHNLPVDAELNEQEAHAVQGAGHTGGANFLFGDGSVRMGDGSVRPISTSIGSVYDPQFQGGVRP